MAARVGKPDLKGLDSALNIANAPVNLAFNKPFGTHVKEKPINSFLYTNPITSAGNATNRLLANSSSPSKGANIIANNYNTMTALGNAATQADAQNYNNYLTIHQTNNALDQANAAGVNQTSQFNANALNAHNQYLANLTANVAQQKLEHNAGWYNNLYGNISEGFAAANALDKEARTHDLLARLAATGALGTMSPDNPFGSEFVKYADAAYGGKINRRKKNKRRGGLTF